ncbi:hypothetical protein TZ01_00095 [Acidiplasma sp. MBA-1]|jgi:hypothetical protein|nr:hypothetical protein TZ01_00095 [Acidiplasma sp. MBA-1]
MSGMPVLPSWNDGIFQINCIYAHEVIYMNLLIQTAWIQKSHGNYQSLAHACGQMLQDSWPQNVNV